MKKSDLIRVSELLDTRRKSTYYDKKTTNKFVVFREFFSLLLIVGIIALYVCCRLVDSPFFGRIYLMLQDFSGDLLAEIGIAIVSLIVTVFTIIISLSSEDFYGINTGKFVLSHESVFLNTNRIIVFCGFLLLAQFAAIIVSKIAIATVITVVLLLLFVHFTFNVVYLINSSSTFHDKIREYCLSRLICQQRKHMKVTKSYVSDLFKDMAKNNLNGDNIKLEDDLYILRCFWGYYSYNLSHLNKQEIDIFQRLGKWTKDAIRFMYRNNNIKYALILTRRASSRLYANHYHDTSANSLPTDLLGVFDFSSSFLEIVNYLKGQNIYEENLEDLIRDNLFVMYLTHECFGDKLTYEAGSIFEITKVVYNSICENTCMLEEEKQLCIKRIFCVTKKELDGSYVRRDGQSKNEYFTSKLNSIYVAIVA